MRGVRRRRSSRALFDGVTGRLARTCTAAGLAEAIESLHQNPALRQKMAAWARLWAANEWSLRSAAQRFFAELNSTGTLAALGVAPKTGFGSEPASIANPIYLDMQNPQQASPPNPTADRCSRRALPASKSSAISFRPAFVRSPAPSWRMVSTVYPTYYRTITPPISPAGSGNVVQTAVRGSLGNQPPSRPQAAHGNEPANSK